MRNSTGFQVSAMNLLKENMSSPPSPKLAHGRVVERLDFIIGQQLEQSRKLRESAIFS